MGIPSVDRLGAEIERTWRSIDYAPAAFPELAERLLRNADLPGQMSVDDLVSWCLQTPSFPAQVDPISRFGQPPVTLFRAPRFYIDALFWIDGTTTIHQHVFSGAFQVLAGSSIETLFAFDTERTFDGHFLLGALRPRSSGLLRQGVVRPILNGPQLIHALFHLERPSVSLVVRTGNDPGTGPQFNYTRSGIARNPFLVDEAIDRKLQIVSMLRAAQHPLLEALVGDLIERSDLHTSYRIVRHCATLGGIDRLIDRVRDKDAAERFRISMKDYRRETFLIGRRNVVSEPDLRFFLGVLLNAPRLRDVLEITRQMRSDLDPARQVASWLRQLSTITVKLQVEGIPWQPNLLGLPDFDDDLESACVRLLSNQPATIDEKTAGRVAQLRALPALACLFDD